MRPRSLEIGRSRHGRPIVARIIGAGRFTLVVIPGIHGDEPLGPTLVHRWARLIETRPPRHVRVVLITAANPDGLACQTKDNAVGVDLNRNFPSRNWGRGTRTGYFPGSAPASEPETRSLLELMSRLAHVPTRPRRKKPRLYLLTLHEPFGFVNYDGPALGWARAIARANGYEVNASVGYPTPGSLGTYFGVERKLPVITLELAREPTRDAWKRHRPALDAALAFVAAHAARN